MAVCVVIRDEEEFTRLKTLGQRLASALEEELELWWEKEHPETRLVAKHEVLKLVKKENPRLLVVAKRAKEGRDDPNRKFSRRLFENAVCQVMVVRMVNELPPDRFKILVPCAGGYHSRRALKLAHAMVGSSTVVFQVRPDNDELSEEIGKRHLIKIVKKAGIAFEEIGHKVQLADDFTETLRDEMKSGDYGMLPQRLLSKGGAATVGVIRAERSKGHRFRATMGRIIQVKVPQLNRKERLALFEDIESKSHWSFDFAALMGLATLIAGMGLLTNSGAVVIGAMLVAPLMMPLIGSGLALVQGNWPLCQRAIGAVLRGFLLALVLGFGMGLVARFLELGVTDQIKMRGSPNVLDLGIAFISGVAASYCIARPKLSGALAGVAIAAALVPPVATVGICYALGATSIAKGAALLFGTNVVAVVLGAGINFFLAGIRGKSRSGEWARRGVIILSLICAGLTVPLTSVLLSKLSRSAQIEERLKTALPEGIHLRSVSKMSGGGYEVTVESPTMVTDETFEKLQQAAGRKIKLRTSLVRE